MSMQAKRPGQGEGLTRRRALQTAAAGAGVVAASQLGFPAVLRAQEAVTIGHLTPLTGFLGQLGEYAVMGAQMAVEEANAGGGVLGRQVQLITEDSVNPGPPPRRRRS